MNPHISIFVGAAPEFDEMLEIFRKMLADPFWLHLSSAASKYKEACQERAMEAADARTLKLTAELLQLEPLLEEYREACRQERAGCGPGGRWKLRQVMAKIVEIYSASK